MIAIFDGGPLAGHVVASWPTWLTRYGCPSAGGEYRADDSGTSRWFRWKDAGEARRQHTLP